MPCSATTDTDCRCPVRLPLTVDALAAGSGRPRCSAPLAGPGPAWVWNKPRIDAGWLTHIRRWPAQRSARPSSLRWGWPRCSAALIRRKLIVIHVFVDDYQTGWHQNTYGTGTAELWAPTWRQRVVSEGESKFVRPRGESVIFIMMPQQLPCLDTLWTRQCVFVIVSQGPWFCGIHKYIKYWRSFWASQYLQFVIGLKITYSLVFQFFFTSPGFLVELSQILWLWFFCVVHC